MRFPARYAAAAVVMVGMISNTGDVGTISTGVASRSVAMRASIEEIGDLVEPSIVRLIGEGDAVRYVVAPGEEWLRAAIPLPQGYALTSAITMHIWPLAGEVVASTDDLGLHAFGVDPEEAIRNLGERLVEERERLIGFGDRLSPQMRQFAALLQSAVVPRHG
jgi:hypothetical protein